ncbi:Probable carboxylesterase 13 [Linum grandiflorum]
MANSSSADLEIEVDLSPMIRVYKNGTVERLVGTQTVPALLSDPETTVQSKDVPYSLDPYLQARIYIPKETKPGQKLPLLVYYHGGGFVIETAFSPMYHNHLNILVAEANVVAVSVDYRRAPESPLPIPYEDCWAALKWAGSHAGGSGPEQWLNDHADFGSVFLAGDSAGANIVHHVAMRFGQEEIKGIPQLKGSVMVHPYFAGKEPVGNESVLMADVGEKLWKLVYPTTRSGLDDPYINPAFDPKLSELGCSKVMIMVAEKDFLKDRGNYYYKLLKESEWKGEVEIVETDDEGHVFHLKDNCCGNALDMRKKICSFINN